MANPIKWISKKAKELRRKHPREKWASLIKQASAAYRSEHKAGSPVAKKRRPVKRRRVSSVKVSRTIGRVKRKVSGTRPPGARITRHRRSKAGGTQPIAWYVVKAANMGFKKSGRHYVTLGPAGRRIVWQTWDEREAKAYLKKHCIKDK